MSTTLDAYPALVNALEATLCETDEPEDTDIAWDRVIIPAEWIERFNKAENVADTLLDQTVGDVVPEDQLNTETASPEMTALGALAEDGEVKDLIYANTEDGLLLKEVLEACTEGDLRPLILAQAEEDEVEDEVEDEEDELDEPEDDDVRDEEEEY